MQQAVSGRRCARIKPRTRLFRNFDQEFERILARKSAERKIGVGWELADTSSGFA